MDKRNETLEKSLKFLVESIDEKGGSRAYYSRIYNPLKGWSLMYPETSGYIIPTLISCYEEFNDEVYLNKAIKMADWLLSIQFKDGSFPGLLYKKNSNNKSIFNSAQILIGLTSLYKKTKTKKYLIACEKCSRWIVKNQEVNGLWIKYSYKDNFMPSYYSRVAWPLLLVWEITHDKELLESSNKSLELIYNRKLKNGFIRDSGFQKDSYAFIHTIAYVIRGFFEASLIIENEKYKLLSIEWARTLLKKFELRNKLPGAYYEDYKGINNFECLTGYCQLAIIWLKIFNSNQDITYVNAALKAIDKVEKNIPKNNFIMKNGGVPGSAPYYGRYMAFRQPNWATKFLIDALLLEKSVLSNIESKFN